MTLTKEISQKLVTVQLTGKDGNAFAIMGAVARAMKTDLRDEYSHTEIQALINEYQTEAMSGDYDNLLCVSMEYADVR